MATHMSHMEEKKRTVDSCMSDLLQLGESVQSALETLPSPVATRNDTPMPVTGAPAAQREQTTRPTRKDRRFPYRCTC